MGVLDLGRSLKCKLRKTLSPFTYLSMESNLGSYMRLTFHRFICVFLKQVSDGKINCGDTTILSLCKNKFISLRVLPNRRFLKRNSRFVHR